MTTTTEPTRRLSLSSTATPIPETTTKQSTPNNNYENQSSMSAVLPRYFDISAIETTNHYRPSSKCLFIPLFDSHAVSVGGAISVINENENDRWDDEAILARRRARLRRPPSRAKSLAGDDTSFPNYESSNRHRLSSTRYVD